MYFNATSITYHLRLLCSFLAQTSNKEILDIKFILVPTSILLISFAWCPKLKKLQIDHDLVLYIDDPKSDHTSAQQYENEALNTDLSETTMSSNITLTEDFAEPKKTRKKWKDDTQKIILESNTARGKAVIINSLFKIVFIPLFCAAVAHFMKVVKLKQLRYGFHSIFQDQTLTWMFFTQILSSFIG